MDILIVDDEPLAAQRLTDLIDRIGGHQVIGTAVNGREAVRKAERLGPDVVLLDIEMPGMGGLEAARAIKLLEEPPVTIFCTAYDEHAIGAFEAAAIDYLLKPVRAERLGEALDRALRYRSGIDHASDAAIDDGPRSHLCARVRGGLQLVPVEEVICLLAEDKYVVVVHDDGETLVEDSLVTLEEEFSDRFLRVHRNALTAMDRVVGLARDRDGAMVVHLRGTERRPEVSRRNLPRVRKVIKNL